MKIESNGVVEMGIFMLANKVTDLENRVEKLEEMGEKVAVKEVDKHFSKPTSITSPSWMDELDEPSWTYTNNY